MEIYVLDKDFQLIATGLPYSNLQWNRKYYEAGDFQLEISAKIYDDSWAYVGTTNRPELGMIQKIQLFGEGDVNVLLSGYFFEKILDDKVCYPRYVGDAPNTETAVRNIFERYKEDLPIELAPPNEQLLGDRTQSDFSDEPLGTKIFSMLESRECSYRILYDYVNNKLLFKVWKGLDRTQSQEGDQKDHNPYQVFSTEFGNITDKTIDIDESGYKNYAVIPVNADDSGKEVDTFYLDLSNGGYKKKIVFDFRASRPEEGQSPSDFKASIIQEATERLLSYAKIEDIEIQQAGAVGYMVDYDLGDKCDVLLSDVDKQAEMRIVEVNEVFKPQGGHTVSVGLGNKRITNIRRAINSI